MSFLHSIAYRRTPYWAFTPLALMLACNASQEDDIAETGFPPDDAVDVAPLFDASTTLEPATVFERDGAMITRFADRGRDRHAREDEFQSYDHYLPRYWEYRTARVQITDPLSLIHI